MAKSRQVGLCCELIVMDSCHSMYKMLTVLFLCCLIGLQTVSGAVTDDCAEKFPKCICNNESVECHGEERITDITKFYHCVEDNVTKIIIQGSKIMELPANTMGSCQGDSSLVLLKLILLDLSNNSIEKIHGKSFHCIPNLQTLILAHNQWRVYLQPDHTGYFSSLPKLEHLDLTNAFEDIWNGTYHMVKLAAVFEDTDMSQLQTLKLAHNEFFSFSVDAANSLCNLDALKTLDLSHNSLEYPSLPTKRNCLESLEYLNVSYNTMPALPKEFMDKIDSLQNLKEVKLDNNPFNCDCGLIETWHWLNSTRKPVNKNELKCASGFHSSYIHRPILSLKPADLRCVQLEEPSSSAVKAVVGIIFAVIILTLAAFLIIHRANLKLIAKRWKKRLPTIRFRSHQGYSTVHDQVAVI